jgi:hypothetical protein
VRQCFHSFLGSGQEPKRTRLDLDFPIPARRCFGADIDARQSLSATKVLLDREGGIAGFYTLATGQVDFGDLPSELARKLARRALPVAILAWLGVSTVRQSQKLGDLLLAQALRDFHEAGQTFAFVAVILDCVDDRAKAFYQRWDFAELPGSPFRLFLSSQTLSAMVIAR